MRLPLVTADHAAILLPALVSYLAACIQDRQRLLVTAHYFLPQPRHLRLAHLLLLQLLRHNKLHLCLSLSQLILMLFVMLPLLLRLLPTSQFCLRLRATLARSLRGSGTLCLAVVHSPTLILATLVLRRFSRAGVRIPPVPVCQDSTALGPRHLPLRLTRIGSLLHLRPAALLAELQFAQVRPHPTRPVSSLESVVWVQQLIWEPTHLLLQLIRTARLQSAHCLGKSNQLLGHHSTVDERLHRGVPLRRRALLVHARLNRELAAHNVEALRHGLLSLVLEVDILTRSFRVAGAVVLSTFGIVVLHRDSTTLILAPHPRDLVVRLDNQHLLVRQRRGLRKLRPKPRDARQRILPQASFRPGVRLLQLQQGNKHLGCPLRFLLDLRRSNIVQRVVRRQENLLLPHCVLADHLIIRCTPFARTAAPSTITCLCLGVEETLHTTRVDHRVIGLSTCAAISILLSCITVRLR